MSQIQTLAQCTSTAIAEAKQYKSESLCSMLQKKDLVESSIFGGQLASQSDVELIQAKLISLFPKMNTIAIGEIANTVLEEHWTLSRLNHAFKEIKKHPYSTFPIGEFLGYDKKITFAKSEIALRRKLKFEITINDVVVVKLERKYTDADGVEKQDWFRAYAYKEEAQEVIPERIVGVWDDKKKCFSYSEIFYDHTVEVRKDDFKKSLFIFCNKQPYEGDYDVDVVKQFFEYWSIIVPPGDKMLFECEFDFDIERRLYYFDKKLKEISNNQN